MIPRWIYTLFIIIIFAIISCTLLASFSPERALDQLIFFTVGGIVFLVLQKISFRFFFRLAPLLYGATLVLLLFTFVLGVTAKGSTRWVTLGPFRLQASEFAKPILALSLAVYTKNRSLLTQKEFSLAVALTLLIAGLVFVQPDLGSSMVLFSIGGGALILARTPWKLFIPWIGFGVIAAIVLWNIFLYDYQKQRILSFLSSDEHAQGASYNARQAVIAVGSGKLLGRGLGHGIQSNLQFLPEHQTDFFFASLAEELGLIGVLGIFLLYGMLFTLLYRTADSHDPAVQVFAGTTGLYLFFQASVHIGMNTGLLPVTGIPLPLLSAGGSSVISTCIALGLASNARPFPHLTKTRSF